MFTFSSDNKIHPEAEVGISSDTASSSSSFGSSAEPIGSAPKLSNKFKNAIQAPAFDGGETNLSALEDLLETEKQNNKLEAWNKLDKTSRVQKLHAFAEKYGREHGLPVKEIKNLKVFFTMSLDKGRLNRAKDVVYDRELREVKSVPTLHFNNDSKSFTLRNLDDKRVSTLKCLTPSRRTPKAASSEDIPKVASSEDIPKVASSEDIPKVASSEDIPKVASSEDIPKAAEDIPKVASSEDIPKAAEDIPKVASSEDIPKAAEDIPKVASSEAVSQSI